MKRALGLGVAAIMALGLAAHALSPPGPVPLGSHARLIAWRLIHLDYRWATDADCRCDDDLRRARTQSQGPWKARPDYHPYRVRGDFNGDGQADLALGVVRYNEPGDYHVLIVDGRPVEPLFLSGRLPHGAPLFYGAPRPRPYRLLAGPFESEAASFEPTGRSRYRLEAGDCC